MTTQITTTTAPVSAVSPSLGDLTKNGDPTKNAKTEPKTNKTDKADVVKQIRDLARSLEARNNQKSSSGAPSYSEADLVIRYASKALLSQLATTILDTFQLNTQGPSQKNSKEHKDPAKEPATDRGIELGGGEIHAFKDANTCRVYILLNKHEIGGGTFKTMRRALRILFGVVDQVPQEAKLCARLDPTRFEQKDYQDFLTSFACLKYFNHPTILKVFDDGWVKEKPVAYTELYQNGDLHDFLQPQPLGETLTLFDQMAACVETAHKKNLPHRDIKPENFLIDFNKATRICLTDFFPGQPSTTSFRSPEMQRYFEQSYFDASTFPSSTKSDLSDEKKGKEADIWSLALSYCYLLSKNFPKWQPIFYFLQLLPKYQVLLQSAQKQGAELIPNKKESELTPNVERAWLAQAVREDIIDAFNLAKKEIEESKEAELAKFLPSLLSSSPSAHKQEKASSREIEEFLEKDLVRYGQLRNNLSQQRQDQLEEIQKALTALIKTTQAKITAIFTQIPLVNKLSSKLDQSKLDQSKLEQSELEQLILDMVHLDPSKRPDITTVRKRLQALASAAKK